MKTSLIDNNCQQDLVQCRHIQMGLYVVHRHMKCLHHHYHIKQRNLLFYLSSANMSLHFVTADIITDNLESDLNVTEHGHIHQHVLKSDYIFKCSPIKIVYIHPFAHMPLLHKTNKTV